MKTLGRMLSGAAMAVAFCVTGAAAQGEDASLTQSGALFHFDSAGHRFAFPLPDWLTAAERLNADVAALVQHNTYADDRQAFVEFFPAGQSFDDWTTTYAARITLDTTRTLTDYRNATIFGYSKPCNPKLTGYFVLGEETPDDFPPLVFVCGAYLDAIKTLKGQGEVMVSVFRKTDKGVGVVYQEWKGPVFDPSDPVTWPVSRADLEARAAELQQQSSLILRSGT